MLAGVGEKLADVALPPIGPITIETAVEFKTEYGAAPGRRIHRKVAAVDPEDTSGEVEAQADTCHPPATAAAMPPLLSHFLLSPNGSS